MVTTDEVMKVCYHWARDVGLEGHIAHRKFMQKEKTNILCLDLPIFS